MDVSHLFKCVIFFGLFMVTQESEQTCGKTFTTGKSTHENRIVGGYDIGYYKYPWYAALIHKGIVGCGGSLINSRTVLTAAHCYKDFLNGSEEQQKLEDAYIIKLGVYNVCLSESTQFEVKAEKVIMHELYLKKNPFYDICIVQLTANVEKFVPVCLPPKAVTKRPREGLVSGLGVLQYDGATPCTMHEARILIYPDTECKTMINNADNTTGQLQKAFCGGYLQGGIDSCQGDSGGPLHIVGEDGEHFLLGIVSFGYECAKPGMLGLYTDVSQYLDWIRQHSAGELPQNNESASTTIKSVITSPIRPVNIKPANTGNQAAHLPPYGQINYPYYNKPHIFRPMGRPINIFIINRNNPNSPTEKIKP